MPIMPRGPLNNSRETIKVATYKVALVRDYQCFVSSRAIVAPSAANPALAKPTARAYMHTGILYRIHESQTPSMRRVESDRGGSWGCAIDSFFAISCQTMRDGGDGRSYCGGLLLDTYVTSLAAGDAPASLAE